MSEIKWIPVNKRLVLKNIKIIGFTFDGALILHAEDDICDFFKETNLIKHNLSTGEKYFIVNIKKKIEDLINDPYSVYKGLFNGDDITVEIFTTKVPKRNELIYKLYYLHSGIPEKMIPINAVYGMTAANKED